jgi:acetyltransferase
MLPNMTIGIAPAHYLSPLLAPRSVAVIGASGRADSLGRVVYENLLGGAFEGELFAVNPNHATVLNRPAYASLAAIGKRVDLAVICAPPRTIPAILDGGRGRLRAAVVLSGVPTASAEVERRWLQQISQRARAAGVRVLGPQTFGVIRTSLGLNATYSAVTALPGRLSLITQSGAIAMSLLDFARSAGIGFASVAALGSGTDVDTSELLEFALADPETDGILLYLETVSDARRFMSALRAAARAKPVVVLKAGRGQAAAPGTPSADRVFDAALRRAGTVRVETYTQLFAATRVLAGTRAPRGNRLAILTNGRGPGLLAADRAVGAGIALASLTRETKAALARLLPEGSRLENPVDLRGEAPPDRFAAALRVVLADANVDAGVVLHVATPAAPPTDTARAVSTAAKDSSKPLFAAWLGAVNRPEAAHALEAGGLANFFTPENAVIAFSFMVAYRRNQQLLLEAPPPQAEVAPPDMAAAERIHRRARASGTELLPPREARALVQAFGVALTGRSSRRGAQRQHAASVDVGVYRDSVFGPVITLRAAHATGSPEVMLPPLNRKLAIDLIAGACAPLSAAERDPLVSLLLAVSTLVCVLPWVIEIDLLEAVVTGGGAKPARARVLIDPRRSGAVHGYRHMAIHPYPAELETTLKLKSGRILRVRPIRPEDAVAERAFVAGLSEESKYRRFMHHLHDLTPQMLARFTQVDYDRELALIALQGKRPEKIVAVARYIANPDAESAEFAIVVADALHGQGLGRALMRLLIACARRRGFRRLVGSVLATNAPMLAMIGGLGFVSKSDPNDREQMISTLELDGGRKTQEAKKTGPDDPAP